MFLASPLHMWGNFFKKCILKKYQKLCNFALKCKHTHTKDSPNGSPKANGNLEILWGLLRRSGCTGQPPDVLGYRKVLQAKQSRFLTNEETQVHLAVKSKHRAILCTERFGKWKITQGG